MKDNPSFEEEMVLLKPRSLPATRPILYQVCILDPMCRLHFMLTDFTLLFC